jgi:peroxiredoxin
VDAIWLLARGALAMAFTVAAAAKVVDRAGTRRAAGELGVPGSLVPAVAVLLPVVEVAIVLGLLAGPTAVVAAWATVALLAAFSVVVARTLAQGKRPDCGCFGAVTRSPIGWPTLARNAGLAGLAVAVALTADGSVIAHAREVTGTGRVVVAVGGAALLVVAGWALVRRRPPVTDADGRPVPLEPGTPAPALSLPDLDGATVTLDDLVSRGSPLLVVFASTTCGSCRSLLPQLASWQASRRDRITISVVVRGEVGAVRAEAERCGLADVLVDDDGDAMADWRVPAVPSAALVTPDGVLSAAVGVGDRGVFELVLDGLGLGEVVRPLVEGYEVADGGDEPGSDASLVAPDALGLDAAPRSLRSTVLVEHGDELVLVERAHGAVVLLNRSAATVWQCLDGEGTLAEIAEDVSDVFGVKLDRARSDVIDTARQLGTLGLLAGVGTPPPDQGASDLADTAPAP